MGKLKRFLLVALFAIVSTTSFVVYGVVNAKADQVTKSASDSLVYALDFADLKDGTEQRASVVGSVTYTEDAVNGSTALNMTSTGIRKNYVKLPAEVVNYDSVTIAGWVKIDANTPRYSRIFELESNHNGSGKDIMLIMPTFYHAVGGQGRSDFNFKMAVKGNTLRQVEKSGSTWEPDSTTDTFTSSIGSADGQISDDITNSYSNTPWVSTVYDSWHHIAWEFTPTAIKYYMNGQLAGVINETDICQTDRNDHANNGYTKTFSLSNIYNAGTTNFYLGAAFDSTNDFTGSFADFRVYNKALSEEEIVSEYDLDYTDFLTTSFDFEDGTTTDSVSGTQGTLVKTAKIENGKLVLDGAGKGQGASQMLVNKNILQGHNNLTITLDAYIDSSTGGWARIFDFATNDQQELALATRWGGNTKTELLAKFTVDEGASNQTISSITTFDNWVNYTLTIKGNVFSLYQNGFLIGVNNNFDFHNSIFSGSAKGKASFGGTLYYNDTPLVGALDNIKIYSVALTADEIKEMANVTTVEFDIEGTELAGVAFDQASWEHALMETNLDFMMKLNKDRLLYNYRLIAGLDTKGATSYGSWISTASGGAGQFEAHYVVALAKASQTMPNYSYNGETVLQRLTYMVQELKKCQDAFAKYDPENAGYLGAIGTEHYDAIADNTAYGAQVTTVVTRPDGTTYNVNGKLWVPWYFNHKNMEAMLDVYWYANDTTLRSTAYTMVVAHADWCANILKKYDADTSKYKHQPTRFEYGGMAEVLFQIYAMTGDVDHFYAAQKFEEKTLLNNWYNNVDTLTSGGNHAGYKGMHANTQIPKVLGAAAAYEATGNPYYYQIAVNAYEMMVARSYAFGGVGRDENFSHEPNELEVGGTTCETCCSYNLLKLADYLFRWTGDVKYAHYFEKTYTNHILASMAPDTGLKTYFVSTAFGGHKIYHTQDTTFWCCSCTGMESFAKLPYGIYYTDKDGDVIVNMFYSSTFNVKDGLTLVQSGDFYNTQKTKITVNGSGSFAIKVRVPDWAKNGFTLKVNGTVQNITATNGYLVLDRVWNNGDYIDYEVPFSVWLENLNNTTGYKAMHYGPLVMVAKLDAVPNGDDVRTSQTNVASAYTGSVKDEINHLGAIENSITISNTEGYPTITVSPLNQDAIKFVPFNRVFHNRYGMYFNYTETKPAVGDRTALNAKIAEIEVLDKNLYTTSSISVLEDAVDAANSLASDANQFAVDTVLENIVSAQNALKLRATLAKFNQKVSELSSLNETDYTTASWSKLQKHIADVQNADLSDVSEEEMDANIVQLENLVKALKQRGDRTALDAKIAEIEALNEADYTAETWALLQSKLNQAKSLSDGALQSEINYHLNQITSAMNALEEKVVDVPDEPENPDEPDTPSEPNEPTEPDEDVGDTPNNGSSSGFNCNMGVGSDVYVIFLTAMLLTAYIVIRKLRRI